MRDYKILYFSLNRDHVTNFNEWAKSKRPVKWLEESLQPILDDLPRVICEQRDKNRLYVIIDYLSLIKDIDDEDAYKNIAAIVRRTIIQFPEVNFLFDQSCVPDDWISGIEFLLGCNKDEYDASLVAQGFHIFRKKDGFVLLDLDYDNIFDGSNLRWAVKKKYYAELELENEDGNFENLQTARKDSLAIVVDDEPRQSRFNGFALYAAGYRVIQACTAKMLLVINDCVNQGRITKPEIILRDFDLQFPDASKRKDYNETTNTYTNVPLWDKDWNVIRDDIQIDLTPFGKGGKIIDSIRNYHYDNDSAKKGHCPWGGIRCNTAKKGNCPSGGICCNTETILQKEFWSWAERIELADKNNRKNKKKIPYLYVITNGHDMMHINHSKYKEWEVDNKCLEIWGIEKPVSGLYHPFFTMLKDDNGKSFLKNHFRMTRYKMGKDGVKYHINKKRKNHQHGVPVDIYDTICEMQQRAETYYENKHYMKAAIVAQETIELLNGFHYQMMIKAYQLKFLAENCLAMNIIGADEKQLVLDVEERIKIIKEDIHRIVYSQHKGIKHNPFAYISLRRQRRKKECELLEHIFSDCRIFCRDNEHFESESVFIGALAQLNEDSFISKFLNL